MKNNKIVILFVLTILFWTISIDADEVINKLDPNDPGPYHIGYYKVIYTDPSFGNYIATIRYPAKYDGFFAPKDISEAPYAGIVVANGFAGSEWNIKWIPTHLTPIVMLLYVLLHPINN